MDQSGILSQAPTERRSTRERQLTWAAKRVLDIGVCLLLFPFGLVLFAVISLWIRLDSPGPALFIQPRIGKNGKPFRMYKFRSMQAGEPDRNERDFMQSYIQGDVIQADNDQIKPMYKPDHSGRITRAGRFLRKTSLDELPQLINIIKGEMSLVGPRPNVPWEVESYQDWHFGRLETLPGVTGLAQVRGRSGLPFDAIVKLDLEYIEKQSLSFDLKILWWTLLAVASRHGAA